MFSNLFLFHFWENGILFEKKSFVCLFILLTVTGFARI